MTVPEDTSMIFLAESDIGLDRKQSRVSRSRIPHQDLITTTTSTTIVSLNENPAKKNVRRTTSPTTSPRNGGRIPPSGDIWRRLANCESTSGTDSASGKYHGYFQFDLKTWEEVGETGDPHTYSYDHQKKAATRLQAKAGWGRWPRCASKLGLI